MYDKIGTKNNTNNSPLKISLNAVQQFCEITHMCFNITIKGQIIVPDYTTENLRYTKNMSNIMFSIKIEWNSDSILSSCGF